MLVVHRGRIVAVGDAATTRVPAGAARRDVAGKVILPGLVDTHSHIGSVEGADASAPLQPDVRVLDSIDVRSPQIQKAQAGGITTVNVMPGSGHLLSGQTLYLKLRDGGTIDDLTMRDADGRLRGGIKMANGTNSRRAPPVPGHAGQVGRARARAAGEGAGVPRQGQGGGRRRRRSCPRATSGWRRWWRCWRASAWCTSTPTATTTS